MTPETTAPRSETAPIIERFRQMCGTKNDDGYFLEFDSFSVPNSLFTGGKFDLPEIIIRPLIIDSLMGINEETINGVRIQTEFYHMRVQVDVYAATLSDMMQIKNALLDRINNFTYNVEVIEYEGRWIKNDDDIFYIDATEPGDIASVKEGKQELVEVEEYTDLMDVDGYTVPGTYCEADDAFYLVPFGNIEDIRLYKLLNGLLFDNGHTAFRDGIIQARRITGRRVGDPEPDAERYMTEFLVSYERTKILNQGEIFEEEGFDLNVSTE